MSDGLAGIPSHGESAHAAISEGKERGKVDGPPMIQSASAVHSGKAPSVSLMKSTHLTHSDRVNHGGREGKLAQDGRASERGNESYIPAAARITYDVDAEDCITMRPSLI